MKIVVTSGDKFTDIDVLACAIAYTELLKAEGKDVEAVLGGVFNKSVTTQIKNWDIKYSTKFRKADAFVIVDTSHPKFFSSFVDEKKIIELYDHHSGFDDFFKKLLGKNCHIELIGACATLIWEEYIKRSKPLKISKESASLLYTAILSNTLNFNAQITHQRDRTAAKQLLKHTSLPKNWVEKYFKDQDKLVFSNPLKEIVNDTHLEDISQFNQTIVIGQLELWDSRKFIKTHLKEVEKALKSFNKPIWFFTSPSISEGKNHIFTKNQKIKNLLSETINAKFDGNLGTTKKLWLRKEILKKFQEKG